MVQSTQSVLAIVLAVGHQPTYCAEDAEMEKNPHFSHSSLLRHKSQTRTTFNFCQKDMKPKIVQLQEDVEASEAAPFPAADDSNNFSSETSTSTDDNPNAEKKPQIAAKENQAVLWSRVLVLAVLVISAALTALMAYVLLSKAEQKDFENDVSVMCNNVSCATGSALLM